MPTTVSQDLQSALAGTSYDDYTVREGTHLIGAGPARRGWAAYSPAGAGLWLGRSRIEALAEVARLDGPRPVGRPTTGRGVGGSQLLVRLTAAERAQVDAAAASADVTAAEYVRQAALDRAASDAVNDDATRQATKG